MTNLKNEMFAEGKGAWEEVGSFKTVYILLEIKANGTVFPYMVMLGLHEPLSQIKKERKEKWIEWVIELEINSFPSGEFYFLLNKEQSHLLSIV